MANKYNLTIDQGASFYAEIELLDVTGQKMVLNDLTAVAQFRKHYSSSNCVSFTTNVASGNLVLTLTPTQTANVVPGRYQYDVELVSVYDANSVTRVLEGIVTVTPNITR